VYSKPWKCSRWQPRNGCGSRINNPSYNNLVPNSSEKHEHKLTQVVIIEISTTKAISGLPLWISLLFHCAWLCWGHTLFYHLAVLDLKLQTFPCDSPHVKTSMVHAQILVKHYHGSTYQMQTVDEDLNITIAIFFKCYGKSALIWNGLGANLYKQMFSLNT